MSLRRRFCGVVGMKLIAVGSKESGRRESCDHMQFFLVVE